jgi:hypothetical protein
MAPARRYVDARQALDERENRGNDLVGAARMKTSGQDQGNLERHADSLFVVADHR